jgi:hypothetical protein
MRSDLKRKKKRTYFCLKNQTNDYEKNIFKVTLLIITIIFSSSSVLAQSNDKKKLMRCRRNGYGDGWNEKL